MTSGERGRLVATLAQWRRDSISQLLNSKRLLQHWPVPEIFRQARSSITAGKHERQMAAINYLGYRFNSVAAHIDIKNGNFKVRALRKPQCITDVAARDSLNSVIVPAICFSGACRMIAATVVAKPEQLFRNINFASSDWQREPARNR